jgi:hypothetical protein
MAERRRTRRAQVYGCAKISVNQTLQDCVVRDFSSLGAGLAFISTANIPDTFELTFDAALIRRKCRVVWRSHTQIGVEFQEASFHRTA